GAGILFLDELAQAPPLVQAALLQLTLDRRIGEYELPDGWVVIAASNRQEDRAGAHRLISPLLNRFLHLGLAVHQDDWHAWAIAADIDNASRSHRRVKPGCLCGLKPQRNQPGFASPRSWEFVQRIVAQTPQHLMLSFVGGVLGEGAAAAYIAHRQLVGQLR